MSKEAQQLIAQLQAQARGGAYERSNYETAGGICNAPTGFRDSGTNGQLPLSQSPGTWQGYGQFAVTAKRLTAALLVDLPVPFFNPVDAMNGYRSMLGGELPPGVTVESVQYGANAAGNGVPPPPGAGSVVDRLRITFTDGVNSDVVEVTCSSIAYPGFLLAMVTDMFEVNKIRMTLSDNARTDQFGKELKVKTNNPFGSSTTIGRPPSDFISPDQYQGGIIDIDLSFRFDKQSGMVLPIAPVANFAVTLSIFAPRYRMVAATCW